MWAMLKIDRMPIKKKQWSILSGETWQAALYSVYLNFCNIVMIYTMFHGALAGWGWVFSTKNKVALLNLRAGWQQDVCCRDGSTCCRVFSAYLLVEIYGKKRKKKKEEAWPCLRALPRHDSVINCTDKWYARHLLFFHMVLPSPP